MLKTRVLKPDEFEKLKTTPNGDQFTPENSIAVVLEDENGIVVGRMCLLNLIHVDGTWVSESMRGNSLIHELEKAILEEARRLGLKYVHVYAPTREFEDTLQRANWERLPLSVWIKEI